MTGPDEDLSGLAPEQRELYRRLRRERSGDGGQGDARRAAAAGARGEEGPAPLSFAQQRLWTLGGLAGGAPFGHVVPAFRLAGGVDPDRLAWSLNRIVERHEVLRTTIRSEGEAGPRQEVVDGLEAATTVHDARGDEGGDGSLEIVRRRAAVPFTPGEEPWIRADLVRTGPETSLLALVTHHLAVDGWSIRLLLAELSELYTARAEGRPPELPSLRLQYRDFARWQREQARGPEAEREAEFWRRRLEGAGTGPALPFLDAAPAPSYEGRRERFEVPPDVAGKLRAVAREEEVTLYVVLLAAFGAHLHGQGGGPDVMITTPASSRPLSGTEDLLGNFSCNLPVRLDVSGGPDLRELVRRAAAAVDEIRGHQTLPPEALFGDGRGDDGLDDVLLARGRPMLIFRGTPLDRHLDLPGVEAETVDVDLGTAVADLTVDVTDRGEGDGLTGRVEYRTAAVERADVQRLVAGFRSCLGAAADRPDRPLPGPEAHEPGGPRDAPSAGPAEIEACLEDHPGVEAASVDDGGGAVRVVHAAGHAPTSTELRDHLAERMGTDGLPSLFLPVARLSGEDGGDDAPPEGGGRGARAAAPLELETPEERRVAELWRDLLDVDRVGPADNFFDLGGSSLQAVRFLLAVERDLGRTPGPEVLLRGTLAQVARACAGDEGA